MQNTYQETAIGEKKAITAEEIKSANASLDSFIEGFKGLSTNGAVYFLQSYFGSALKTKSGTVDVIYNSSYIEWANLLEVYQKIIRPNQVADYSAIKENIDFLKKFYSFTSKNFLRIFGSTGLIQNENECLGEEVNRVKDYSTFTNLTYTLCACNKEDAEFFEKDYISAIDKFRLKIQRRF